MSARPLQVRHASRKSPPEVEYAFRGRLEATSATYRIWVSTAHRQWVSEASKGLQLTLQSSELVAIEQRKDKLSEKCGKIIMSLYKRGPEGILQAVKRRAVPDNFKQPFKIRDPQEGCQWRQCKLLKGNGDKGRIQVG